MKKERQSPLKLIVIGCVLAALVVGFYYGTNGDCHEIPAGAFAEFG